MDNELNNILNEQEHVEQDEFLQEVQWQAVELADNWLNPADQYVRPKYTLSYNGVPFAPLRRWSSRWAYETSQNENPGLPPQNLR